MPKVSVIIPNYNHARYLPQRLNSVMAQTYKDFEVIIMDDHSTDGSRDVIMQYLRENPDWKYIPNTENSGSPFHQWNKGVDLASGEYIWIAESDDYCSPHLLEKLVPLVDNNPNVGIAYAQSQLVDEEGDFLGSYGENLKFIYKSDTWEKAFVKNGLEACREWLIFNNPIPNASGILMRRSAYLNAGKAVPDMRLNGDWFLYTKILLKWDLAFIPDELNYFRVHRDTQRERERDNYQVYDDIIYLINFIQNNVPESEENAKKALKKVSFWWAANLPYQKFNRKNLQGNLRLYRTFKKTRKNLLFAVIYKFTFVYLRKILTFFGLIRLAKRTRSMIFPGKYFDR